MQVSIASELRAKDRDMDNTPVLSVAIGIRRQIKLVESRLRVKNKFATLSNLLAQAALLSMNTHFFNVRLRFAVEPAIDRLPFENVIIYMSINCRRSPCRTIG